MNLTEVVPSLLPLLSEPSTAVVIVCLAALVVVGIALSKIPRP